MSKQLLEQNNLKGFFVHIANSYKLLMFKKMGPEYLKHY